MSGGGVVPNIFGLDRHSEGWLLHELRISCALVLNKETYVDVFYVWEFLANTSSALSDFEFELETSAYL